MPHTFVFEPVGRRLAPPNKALNPTRVRSACHGRAAVGAGGLAPGRSAGGRRGVERESDPRPAKPVRSNERPATRLVLGWLLAGCGILIPE